LKQIGTECAPTGVDGMVKAVPDGRWKLIRNPVFDRGKTGLYDLDTDPRELINLNREHPEIAFRLEQELREFTSGNSREGEVDKELRNKLRSLGYIE